MQLGFNSFPGTTKTLWKQQNFEANKPYSFHDSKRKKHVELTATWYSPTPVKHYFGLLGPMQYNSSFEFDLKKDVCRSLRFVLVFQVNS